MGAASIRLLPWTSIAVAPPTASSAATEGASATKNAPAVRTAPSSLNNTRKTARERITLELPAHRGWEQTILPDRRKHDDLREITGLYLGAARLMSRQWGGQRGATTF